jgi:hypothetical protein
MDNQIHDLYARYGGTTINLATGAAVRVFVDRLRLLL